MADPKIKVNSTSKTSELGDTAGVVLNGYIQNEEYNDDLKGTKRVKVFNQMRLGDATVQAALRVVKLPILKANWMIEPASEEKIDQEVADFVEEQLFDQPTRTWQEMLQNILLYLDFGVMPFEIVWDFLEDDKIGLRKLSPRFPDTIERWRTENGENGVTQTTTKGTFSIPIDKMIIFVNQKEGDNWEGISLLRPAYKHWYIKDALYKIDAMATERQGLGIPYAKIPPGQRDSEKDQLEEILQNMRANEKGYVMFPENWDVGIMEMKGGSIKNPVQMINHHDRQIMKNVLAQFLELGSQGSSGSWSLSRDHSQLFIQSIEAVADYVVDVMDRYLIRKIVDYNFSVEQYPKLSYGTIGSIDLNNWTTALQRALQTGALIPDEAIQRHTRSLFDLPESDGETADMSMIDDEMLLDEATLFAPVDEPAVPNEDEIMKQVEEEVTEAMEIIETMTADQIIAEYGTDVARIMQGAKSPLSEEHRKKISEALKEYWRTRKKKKSSGGSRKKKNPEIEKRKSEIKKLRRELRDFNDSVKLEFLEMKARGEKLDDQELAKKKLEIFKRKKELKDRIQSLMDDIDSIKDGEAVEDLEDSREEEEEKAGSVMSRLYHQVSETLNHVKASIGSSD